jgi:hypothetical protein
MTKDKALRLALEVLKAAYVPIDLDEQREKAITAIKAALEAKDEPVGKFAKFTDGIWREVTDGSAGVPLYTTQPQRKPLTDEEIQAEWLLTPQHDKAEGVWFGRRLEAKLKEKNT